jgi:hypothetical protein
VGIPLDQVVPWGRSFDEYVGMFSLEAAELGGRILGCGDGPASFNAEATGRGCRVVACDPIYAFEPAQIRRRVEETYEPIVAGCRRHRDAFVWSDGGIRSPEHLGEVRMAAMERFLIDFATREARAAGRYVPASLPELPFADGAFDLALCSHLLFLYSSQLSEEFHVASVVELSRVAREVRVFPLLTLDGVLSPHVAAVTDAMRSRGHRVERRCVAYEFLRGANEMLVIHSR